MTTTPLTLLPATACENDDHRFAGHCTAECAWLAQNMMSDYSDDMIYGDYLGGESTIDWSGCHRGPVEPEERVDFDPVNRAVVITQFHPEGCECDYRCEVVRSVSDADFGYWDHTWGHPSVHEFPCGEHAVMTRKDPYDGEHYRLCEGCAK
jgi:hypothetical protein